MKTRFNSLVKIVATLSLASITFTQAADQYWNPSPLSDNWANSVWSATSGGGSLSTWTTENNAIFDQAGTYTATINAAQTATNLDIKAGTVTFAGTNTVSATAITIDSGASLTADSARFMKSGTTTLTVNGTLNQTGALSGTGNTISVAGGNGSITMVSGFRTNGDFNFAGNISGAGAIVTQGVGTFTLSGNNTYSGDTLLRSGNTLRLGSSTALSTNSILRMAGGDAMIELTGTHFSRTLATTGAGNVRIGNTGDATTTTSFGFAAVNADRTVALNGTTTWTTASNTSTFSPGTFKLGTAASTHKVTLTTGINLNGATRTINTENGSAAIEAEISGSLSGTGASVLNKTGTGVLLLSNANNHAGGTTIAGSSGAINPLRISHASALGSGTLTIGSGGNNDQSRIELTGGITVTNTIAALASRSNTNDAPNILNVSGNNAINSNISVGGGGDRTTLQSDSGKLTMAGNVSVRRLNLYGAGDGEIQGSTTIAIGNSLVKDGNGTWTVNNGDVNNTTATVSAGKLLVNGTLANSSATVNGGTLGGTGSISGAVTIGALGTLAPTAQADGNNFSLGSTLAFDSGGTSIFNWDLSADASDPITKTQQGNYGQVEVTGAASGTAVFNIALLGGVGKTSSYADAFWDTNKTWNNLFASAGMTDLSTLFTSFTGTGLTPSGSGATAIATAGDRGYFSFNNSTTLTWTAVPEPTTALAGILLGFGLLRRRR